MFRKGLIDFLEGKSMSVSEIAGVLHVSPREVEEDLRHLFKSLKHESRTLQVTPARCLKCHFAFPKDRFTKPGRCPVCHGDWISEPRFRIGR
jgi:predicted Zn-ribbon and HTH transcriptional regulator